MYWLVKEAIICDGILHVNLFRYFKIPYIICIFLQNLFTMNILDLVVFTIFASDPPEQNDLSMHFLATNRSGQVAMNNWNRQVFPLVY